MEKIIRVLIVDDHKLISQAWSALLNDAPSITVVGIADTEESAYNTAVSLRPDIILMDINLGSGSGIEAAIKINNTLPK